MVARSSWCALVVAASVGLSGCSMLLVDQPDDKLPVSKAPRCSTGTGPIVTDVLFATLYGVLGLVGVSSDESKGAGVLSLGLAALHGGSAAAGRSWTSRCRDKYEDHDRYIAANRVLPGADRDLDLDVGDDTDRVPEPIPAAVRLQASTPEPEPEPEPEPTPEPTPAPPPVPARSTHECVGSRCLPTFWREVTPQG